MTTDKATRIDKAQACLLLGATGDALGSAVEFMKLDAILEKYGGVEQKVSGIQYPDVCYGKKGAVTDDTQMALFAADGLIHAHKRGLDKGILAPYWTYTAESYLQWLTTQREENPRYINREWGSKHLHEVIYAQGPRAPGLTCLSALKNMPLPPEPAANDSKSCGAVMRAAPIGLFFGNVVKGTTRTDLQKVYEQGASDAAITHGNPIAHHASGLLAVVIALVLHGESLGEAVETALKYFPAPDVQELYERALEGAQHQPSTESLQALGQGWIAEEALAISLYCALQCANGTLSVADALRLAVNHDGDSDSTGAITGNLIGVTLGTASVSEDLIGTDTEVAEIRELVEEYGRELIQVADYSSESN